jgi:hypothetical protein
VSAPGEVGPVVACAGCARAIRFVTTTAGRQMPVDAPRIAVWIAPTRPPGPLPASVTLLNLEGVVRRGFATGEPGAFVEGYRPHWIDCPASRRFR